LNKRFPQPIRPGAPPGQPSRPIRVAVSIGTNLGDRERYLDLARRRLEGLLSQFRMSAVVETEPVGVTGVQRPFLNAAAVGDTRLDPHALLDALFAIERAAGRERLFPNAPRTLDLDLILYGTAILEDPGLTIPHPRFRERRFVLEPLAAVAPELQDPVTSLTVGELLARLPPAGSSLRR
jgi:2-amino-4-hydroxy-6-hydroxymethyldihydropteridine diphosphokinase